MFSNVVFRRENLENYATQFCVSPVKAFLGNKIMTSCRFFPIMSNFKFNLFSIQEVLNLCFKKKNLNNSECIDRHITWRFCTKLVIKLRFCVKIQSENCRRGGNTSFQTTQLALRINSVMPFIKKKSHMKAVKLQLVKLFWPI